MAYALTQKVLVDNIMPRNGAQRLVREAALVVAGIAVLALAAHIKVPMFPVPVTMTTFAVLTLGAAYGPRRGLITILGYLGVGALGFDVFAGSAAEASGLTYMMGSTGGYLVGYALAALTLGTFARAGWDRSMGRMALAMLVGNVVLYIPGVIWLGQLYGWDQPILAWGVTPFLLGDALKLALAALAVPAVWRLIGRD
ncbi:biotin transporter BioY [Rhodovulum sulfidophilum]|uniref:biotin transporter BioY n=1 Tax=Rhodovulum sulfidophilum TaxID=35806 RepID=UPI000950D331|nr:biotin transporter BioY [Rhodovulum sulfidophilum]MBK5924441.1 biotin transporter BioY [Rhodovulum sulfidophilum]MBL3562450.1 biotin transporter BioY [Rhodovulum sulfidophilum]MBL3567518.1 biotin transporter BioY [Rhodovulum sulfidophilum]MCE8438925.1 biotin transporter BioY [Rhodovulum sulfidophilum]MCE8467684.1 biotin transporter BioY [Rhodovulum sulfidophilum]